MYKPEAQEAQRKTQRVCFYVSKNSEAIRDNDKESREGLFLGVVEGVVKSNPNNTNYQFWQQSLSHQRKLLFNFYPCICFS